MADNSNDVSAEAEVAIDAVYGDYAEAFARDPAAAAAFCGEPTLIVMPTDIVALSTRAELEAFYAALLARLRALGYTHSRLGTRRIKFLNHSTALYSIAFVRMKADGTELEQAAATYLFRRKANGWRIFSLIATDQDKLL